MTEDHSLSRCAFFLESFAWELKQAINIFLDSLMFMGSKENRFKDISKNMSCADVSLRKLVF